MTAFVSKPSVVLGDHEVDRNVIANDMLARYPKHDRMNILPRVLGNLPARRRFSQPWETVISDRTYEERNDTAFADITRMVTEAAQQALKTAGLHASDITAVVTSHTTGDAMPGLDIHLQQTLGLRADIRRRPITQLGCGGGGHALVMAVEHVEANPGAVVLVGAGESLSSIHHHEDDRIEELIFKGLWGDSGAACIVSSAALTPGLEVAGVDATWEFVLPSSQNRYRKWTDRAGIHFRSDKDATRAVRDMSPALKDWIARGSAEGPWPLDEVVSHTGGRRVLDDLASTLGIDQRLLRHSYQSLDEDGNLGAASILRVLERSYADPPADGTRGLAIAFGPGFSVSALKTTRRA